MEELAVIKDVGIGVRDTNEPILWFTAEGITYSSLQIFSWKDAGELLKDNDIREVRDLEGKPCIVLTDNRIMKFVRLQ